MGFSLNLYLPIGMGLPNFLIYWDSKNSEWPDN